MGLELGGGPDLEARVGLDTDLVRNLETRVSQGLGGVEGVGARLHQLDACDTRSG